MIDGKLLIEKVLRYAKCFLHLPEEDEVYYRNVLLREFHILSPYSGNEDVSFVETFDVPDVLTAEMNAYALENGIAQAGTEHLFSSHILGLLTPSPSVITSKFYEKKQSEGISSACKYFYDLSVKNDYVQKTAIGRNLKWEYLDDDTVLEITINLSKPEKDNKEIAKLLTKPADTNKYPKCALCKENVGYGGSATHPARSNIRTIPVTLGGEKWFVQYSPYAYYNEHLIAINEEHTPMKVDASTMTKLLDFVDLFPNYFIGSNAALPIVGGSILNHEHYQGGGHVLPMQKTKVKAKLTADGYPEVEVGVLNWYNSALRLSSLNKEKLISLGAKIIEAWRSYSDESVGIYAFSGGNPHNTLSPIASKRGDKYVVDLIFRNNLTTDEYPDGVYHAHPEYFNIKKEGIGLIEAMGLFILPGRLKRQTAEIEKILTGEIFVDEGQLKEGDDLYVHRNMISILKDRADGVVDKATASKLVIEYINEVCAKILECTAVFKRNDKGFNAFIRFLSTCGLNV